MTRLKSTYEQLYSWPLCIAMTDYGIGWTPTGIHHEWYPVVADGDAWLRCGQWAPRVIRDRRGGVTIEWHLIVREGPAALYEARVVDWDGRPIPQ